MKFKKIIISAALALFIAAFSYIPTAHASELCEDFADIPVIGSFANCDSEDVVSFIDFQGGLTAPSGEGLDQTLTRATNAREFIINSINFALAFLGIIALAVVIYGGFLYVTAAGNEEQSGKGKKAITYAAVGIVIILASFAIVRTLIMFLGTPNADRTGTDTRGVAQEGSNVNQQQIYNLGAAEINSSLNDFITAYKNFVKIKGLINRLNNVPPPMSREENRSYISQVTNVVSEIKNGSNALSEIRQVAQRMLDEYLFRFQSVSNETLTRTYGIEGGGFNTNSDDSDLQHEVIRKLTTQYNFVQAAINDYNNAIDGIIGPKNQPLVQARPRENAQVVGRLPIVWKIMGAVADASASTAIERDIMTDKDLEKAFAGIDPNITVSELFVEAIKKIDDARALAVLDPIGPQNQTTQISTFSVQPLIDASMALYRLYIIVKNIKYVQVRIAASVSEGSAPLLVELNGLNSRDPAARTIPDANYIWDPDGDGAPGVSKNSDGIMAVDCNTTSGATIACAYNLPGTYLVRLDIASQDSEHIAAGRAILPITVKPGLSRINLRAISGAITQDLRRYEQDAAGEWKLVIDKNEMQVTSQEATTSGVNFDAADSKGGSGEQIQMFRWSFGNNAPPQEGADKTRINNIKYPREGRYPLLLEVTDRGGRKDRKIVNVVVGSIAARISANQTIGEPEQSMEFDGSLSRSDSGAITSYTWSILDKDGVDVISHQSDVSVTGNQNSPILRVKFKKPGIYTTQLTVSDGSQTGQTKIDNVAIKSRKPHAEYTVRSCPTDCPNPTQPSVVEFDAAGTFDPDTTDVLTYDWQFFNSLGEELKHPTGLTILDNVQFPSQQVKKIRAKFSNVGQYKVILRVNDSHGGIIQQEDTKEKEIAIQSIVEAGFDQMNPVSTLQNGKATFNFAGNVKNANLVQVDFGDGQTNEQSIDNATMGGRFQFSHDYTEAGSFLVTLTATSDEGKGETVITKRVSVSPGDSPLAVMEVSVDNAPIILPSPSPSNPNPSLEITRNKPVKFDASRSINSEGNAENLRYSWDFGDQKRATGPIVQHSYERVSPENSSFSITLTVSEEQDPTKTSQAIFLVKVISVKPRLNGLSLGKRTSGDITPIDVDLTAEGATDPDGRITNFQFWYYDPADRERKLSVMDSRTNRATVTVETYGEENEEHQYKFCVSETDNDNTTSTCDELLSENQLPTLRVKNGPNQAPNAAFTVDRTNIKVNELVTFTSSSTDSDGRIAQYIWDFEGDGFDNDTPTDQSTVTHRYTRRGPASGYRVKLKVTDDKNAAGYSREIPIYVSAKSNPPTANFTYQVQTSPTGQVKFFDSSTPDAANGARLTKWNWNFDTSGNRGGEVDSTDQNPIHTYPIAGTYQAKLTVEDSDGNASDLKTILINIVPGAAGGTGSSTPVSNVLHADVQTSPAYVMELIGGEQRKVIHVPANANSQDITFMFGKSTGDVVSYKMDKNIWCDANGDGNRANDSDYLFPNPANAQANNNCIVSATGATSQNCWTAKFNRLDKTRGPGGAGYFRTLLIVTDRNQNVDATNVDIIFDGTTDPAKMQQNGCYYSPSLLTASLFEMLGVQKTILLGLISGVTLVLMGLAGVSFLKRGKRREI